MALSDSVVKVLVYICFFADDGVLSIWVVPFPCGEGDVKYKGSKKSVFEVSGKGIYLVLGTNREETAHLISVWTRKNSSDFDSFSLFIW